MSIFSKDSPQKNLQRGQCVSKIFFWWRLHRFVFLMRNQYNIKKYIIKVVTWWLLVYNMRGKGNNRPKVYSKKCHKY